MSRPRNPQFSDAVAALSAATAAPSDHLDARLLALLTRASALYDDGRLARNRGNTAYTKWLRDNCHEAVALDDEVARTPARTPELLPVPWTRTLS